MDKIKKLRIITIITEVISFVMIVIGVIVGGNAAYILNQVNKVPFFDPVGMDVNGQLSLSPSTPMFQFFCISLLGVGAAIVIINIIPCITGIQIFNMIKQDDISEYECMELVRRDGFFKLIASIVPLMMLMVLYFIFRVGYIYFFIAYCLLVVPMLLSLYQIWLCRE